MTSESGIDIDLAEGRLQRVVSSEPEELTVEGRSPEEIEVARWYVKTETGRYLIR